MKCASASAAPTETHYNAVKSIFRYLSQQWRMAYIFGELKLERNSQTILSQLYTVLHRICLCTDDLLKKPFDYVAIWICRGLTAPWRGDLREEYAWDSQGDQCVGNPDSGLR
jgi:hypothetical protein